MCFIGHCVSTRARFYLVIWSISGQAGVVGEKLWVTALDLAGDSNQIFNQIRHDASKVRGEVEKMAAAI